MLHTKLRGIRPTGSKRRRIFKVFNHLCAWRPSWSCDQHHINKFSIIISMYLKVYIQNLIKNGLVVSEKSKF